MKQQGTHAALRLAPPSLALPAPASRTPASRTLALRTLAVRAAPALSALALALLMLVLLSGQAGAAELPLLRVGDQGGAVAEAQRLLDLAGHSPGPQDGIFGWRTRRAVLSFQAEQGLDRDGIIGPYTWRALYRRADNPARGQQRPGGLIWPVDEIRISSGFGPRPAPCSGCSTEHEGIDLAAAYGAAVYAAHPGVVAYAGWARGYGYVIYLRQDRLETRYAHLSAFDVAVGDAVPAGVRIGAVGTSGQGNGRPHLHFETRLDGQAVDPLLLLSERDA